MQTSQVLQGNLSLLESLVESTGCIECTDVDAYIPEQDVRQLYRYGMEEIREKICGVCEGQDRVVMSQLWELGKKSPVGAINRAPAIFPALVSHGFVVERIVDGQAIWEPCSPYLKDFWQVGIQVSNGHGFLLQPEHVFQANLCASLAMIQ